MSLENSLPAERTCHGGSLGLEANSVPSAPMVSLVNQATITVNPLYRRPRREVTSHPVSLVVSGEAWGVSWIEDTHPSGSE